MNRINVADVVDRSRLGPFQILVLVLCGLCMIMDGFDVQAMGYVAPALIKDWQITKTALGPVFGAGLLGIMIGSLGLSIVADRIGRRPVPTITQLLVLRSVQRTTRCRYVRPAPAGLPESAVSAPSSDPLSRGPHRWKIPRRRSITSWRAMDRYRSGRSPPPLSARCRARADLAASR